MSIFIKVRVALVQTNKTLSNSNMCGKEVYVPLEDLLTKSSISDLQVGSFVNCAIREYTKVHIFLCELLSNEVYTTNAYGTGFPAKLRFKSGNIKRKAPMIFNDTAQYSSQTSSNNSNNDSSFKTLYTSNSHVGSKKAKKNVSNEATMENAFMSSNTASAEIKNKYLRVLLANIQMPGVNSFTETILPDLVKQVKLLIINKLIRSTTVILVASSWPADNACFCMGLTAVICDQSLEKDCHVIGIRRIEGAHSAENIQSAIGSIVNEYAFDKSKIKGVVCDEGSSLMHCFSRTFQDLNEKQCIEKHLALNLEEIIENKETSNYTVPSINQLDKEIGEIVEEMTRLNLDRKLNGEELNDITPLDESNEYMECEDASSPIKESHMDVGSSRVPRFSCACHKSNLAVRKAIKSSEKFSKNLAWLAAFSVSNLRGFFHSSRQTQCFRCENCTRWSSSFIMLFHVHKAYRTGCFQGEMAKCPVSAHTVEFYLQILWPAYKFALGLQRSQSNISDVVPSLVFLCNVWRELASNHNFKPMCERLIACFEQEFTFEINSGVYSVAALLNTSKLKLWYARSFASELNERSVNSLIKVVASLNHATTEYLDDDESVFDQLYEIDYDEHFAITCRISENFQIEEEKYKFLDIIQEATDLSMSTSDFWLKHQRSMPNLFNAAMQLLSISSTSVFVERLFSVCGTAGKKQCIDISLARKYFLKTNWKLLEKLESH